MIHTQVYGFFQTCLPDQAKEVKEYFPNGKNSIRIRKTNGQEFIFSLREPKAWKFETIDQFLADMKGEKEHGRNDSLYFRQSSLLRNCDACVC